MNCENCKQQLDPTDSFCDSCGTPVPKAVAIPDTEVSIRVGEFPVASAAPPPEASVTVITPAPVANQTPAPVAPPARPPTPQAPRTAAAPDRLAPRFRLAQDEHVLKTYEAVVLRPGFLRRMRGHGALYVTDARVVFYAMVYPRGTQRQSWLLQQTKLEDISGLHADVSRKVSLGLLVVTVFFALATIGTLLTLLLPLTVLFAILTVLAAALMMWDAARRGSVNVNIQARGYNASSITFGHLGSERFLDQMVRYLFFPFLFFIRFYAADDVAKGDPGRDADQMLHELGALILDLQTRGTMAYSHWGITE
jgi:hypothetical protein